MDNNQILELKDLKAALEAGEISYRDFLKLQPIENLREALLAECDQSDPDFIAGKQQAKSGQYTTCPQDSVLKRKARVYVHIKMLIQFLSQQAQKTSQLSSDTHSQETIENVNLFDGTEIPLKTKLLDDLSVLVQ